MSDTDTPSTDVLRTFAGRQAFDEERELVYWAAERIEKLERELAQARQDGIEEDRRRGIS